jgi:RNA polymerase sigma-70 factor (ECF subfamily)
MDAMRAWTVQHEARLYRLVLNLTDRREDAEAVLEEAFVRGWRKMGRAGADEEQTFEFLAQVAVRETLSLLRFRRGDLRGWLESYDEAALARPRSDSADHFAALEQCTPQELAKFRTEALHALLPMDRVVFVLRHVENLPAEKIATLVHIAVDEVKARVERARVVVRNRLDTWLRQRAALRTARLATSVH